MDARGLGYNLGPGGCLKAGPCQGYTVWSGLYSPRGYDVVQARAAAEGHV